MTNTVNDLLEQLTRLAGYVRHQGEAAKDGVPPSADHLIYLAESTRVAVDQLGAAIEAQAVKEQQRKAAFADLPAGRNAAAIEHSLRRIERIAGYVGRMRLGQVYSFDARGSIFMERPAIGLIEWFYAMRGPKTVKAWFVDDTAYVSVKGTIDSPHDDLDVWTSYDGDEAKAIIAACEEPSIHLLRRLQIAGAQ